MRDIDILKNPKDANRPDRRYLLSLVSFFAGVYGLLFYFQALRAVDYRAWLVYLLTALFGGALWLVHHHQRRRLPGFYLILLGSLGLLVILKQETIAAELKAIRRALQGPAGTDRIAATLTVTLLALLITWLVFLLGYILKGSGLLAFATLLLLLLGPLLDVALPLGSVILLTLYLVTVTVLQTTAHGLGKVPLRLPNRRGLTRQSSLSMGLILLLVLLSAGLLTGLQSSSLYQLVYNLEGRLQRTLKSWSGRSDDPVQGGLVSIGNNYRTGARHLEVSVYQLPDETLYLRGYGGGTYDRGYWLRSRDENLFENIARAYPDEEWSHQLGYLYYSMYNIMNSYMQHEPGTLERSLTIRHTDHTYRTRYVPYFSQSGFGNFSESMPGYSFIYYELSEMNISPENVKPGFESHLVPYTTIQDAYYKQALAAYTQVPTDQVPRLTALCEDNPQSDLDSITRFIINTLHSRATYTLTPGWTPFNQDVTEYFLFEKGEGYCVHFASAATLMYRLYGIPARYASGYAIAPAEFEWQESNIYHSAPTEEDGRTAGVVTTDGYYHAQVTDEAAHAWVEIFIKGYGWVPVEVTPSAADTLAVYPGFEGLDADELAAARSENRSDQRPDSETAETTEETKADETLVSFTLSRTQKTVLLTLLIYTLVLLPIFVCGFWLWRRQRLDALNIRRLFAKYLRLLRFSGCPDARDGSEDHLPDWVEEQTQIPAAETRALVAIVTKAAFGTEPATLTEELFVRNLYKQTAARLYARQSHPRKLIFRFWKAFW